MIVLLASVFGAIILSDLESAHALRNQQRERIEAGLNIVSATAPGMIDASVCEALSTQQGIVGSGSLKEGPLRVLGADRATLIPTGSVSLGMLSLWGHDESTDGPGVVVGAALASDQSLAVGSFLRFVDDDARQIVGVFDETRRSERFAGWAITVVPAHGNADQCWVETEPGLAPAVEPLLAALLGAETPVDVTSMTDLDQTSADLEAQFTDRLAVQLRWPLVLSLIAVGFLALNARRAESGLSRALGMRTVDLAFVTFVEWLAYTLVALMIGASVALTTTYLRWHRLSDKPIWWGGEAALQDVAWPVAVTLSVVPLMAALWPTDIAESLKDR